MSNPTINSVLEQFESTGLLRPVTEVPLHMPNGNPVPNKKAIIYEDTQDYISTVGHRYQVIDNRRAYENLAHALVEGSGLDLTDLSVTSSSSATNARNLIKITLPAHTIAAYEGDLTQLQILTRNSYDGTWKFQIDVGGFRMACANGQIFGDYSNAYHNRHTTNFSLESMADYLIQTLGIFTDMGREWARMKGHIISNDQAIDAIMDYLGKEIKDRKERDEIVESGRARTVHALMDKWSQYKKEMGNNVFALYNTFTDHASHLDDAEQKVDTINFRQKQLTKVILPMMKAA